MLRRINLVIVTLLLMMLCGCSSYNGDVQRALRLAEDNRGELKAVLRHYGKEKQDSLKFRAACFLIANMPHHLSYPQQEYQAYCDEMMAHFNTYDGVEPRFSEKAVEISRKHSPKLIPQEDIKHITAEYLIWNIDYSFKMWEESNFLRHLTFEEFCEYVLPYKCFELQPITRWKEDWSSLLRGELDQSMQIDEMRYNVRRAVESVTWHYHNAHHLVRLHVWPEWGMNFIDILDMPTLARQPYAVCRERARYGIMTCRSKGIPVSMDFTPNWGDRYDGHCWNRVYVDRRRSFEYEPMFSHPGGVYYLDVPMPKVFRLTYAPHPILLAAKEAGVQLPISLNNIFVQDVTSDYGRTADIHINVNAKDVDNDFAFLAVFDNTKWVSVDICKLEKGCASFNTVGLGILYIVMAYKDGGLMPISQPFVVDVDKKVKYIEAKDETVQDMRIYRKFPAFGHIYDKWRFMMGGQIEAADNPDFKDSKVMAVFPLCKFLSGEAIIEDTTAYRYWRLASSTTWSTDMAEMFYYDRATGKIIEGELIYPDLPMRDPKYDTHSHICDRNPLTYYAVDSGCNPSRWIGYDFGVPVSIEKVLYMRRSDGNDVMPGDEYELYYWDEDQWQLHSKQLASNIYVDFKEVPKNRLYWIKGISRGEQNRIFIYENNEVRWY